MAPSGDPVSGPAAGLKPAASDRSGFGTLYYNSHDMGALKIVAASGLLRTKLHLEEVRDRSAPVLFVRSGSGESLQDSFAISWLLYTSAPGGRNHSTSTSLRARSSVLQWHFFCESELKPFIDGLLRNQEGSSGSFVTRDIRFANKQRKERLAKSLDVLNFSLRQNSRGRFLVGDKISLADISVGAALLPILVHAATCPQLREVWGRKDLTYLKHWLLADVLGSKPFASAAKIFPDLQTVVQREQHNLDVNSNSVKKSGEGRSALPGKNNVRKLQKQGTQGLVVKELPPLPSKPFRILCIHGYRQNGNSFREKLGAFRGITGKYLDFTFITAPNHVLPLSAEDINQDQRGWWFSRDSDYFQAQDATDCDKGFDQSLATIVEAFELHGPFHGLMGFSQGAALVALLCLLKARQPDLFSEKVAFQFAIMVAGFRSRSSRHAEFFDQTHPLFKKVEIPTLHVIGDSDRVIDRSMSEEILAFFDRPSVMHHSGAHFVPASAKQKMGYLGFLSKVYETVKPDQEDAGKVDKSSCAGGDQGQGELKADAIKTEGVAEMNGNGILAE